MFRRRHMHSSECCHYVYHNTVHVLSDAYHHFVCYRFMFDEPSSYLDVKQRLKAAQGIRSLIDPDKFIIVVEHDLSVLDYLSDFICCLYGVPGAYGVVTMPFSVREGWYTTSPTLSAVCTACQGHMVWSLCLSVSGKVGTLCMKECWTFVYMKLCIFIPCLGYMNNKK